MTEVIYDLMAYPPLNHLEGQDHQTPLDTFIAGTWSKPDGFDVWETPLALYEYLRVHDRIIGVNTINANTILAHRAGRPPELLDAHSFDLLADLQQRLRSPVSLAQLATGLGMIPPDNGRLATECGEAHQTLSTIMGILSDPRDRWQVIQLAHHFHRRLKHACTADVKLLRDIYRFGQAHGFVYIYHRGRRHQIPVDWHLKEVRQ